jgi:hypothetical protein
MMVSKMNKKIKGEREVNTIKLFGIMLPSMPSLIFRLVGTFLRFKRDANKAGKVFRNRLIEQGIDEKTATELTEIYLQSSHIRKYIQGLN